MSSHCSQFCTVGIRMYGTVRDGTENNRQSLIALTKQARHILLENERSLVVLRYLVLLVFVALIVCRSSLFEIEYFARPNISIYPPHNSQRLAKLRKENIQGSRATA